MTICFAGLTPLCIHPVGLVMAETNPVESTQVHAISTWLMGMNCKFTWSFKSLQNKLKMECERRKQKLMVLSISLQQHDICSMKIWPISVCSKSFLLNTRFNCNSSPGLGWLTSFTIRSTLIKLNHTPKSFYKIAKYITQNWI